MGHEQRSFSLQHLLTALCPLHWNYELVNMSHPMREQGLGVARLRRCREMKEGVSSRGSSDQTVGRQIEQVRALIVHLLCALKIHPVVHSVYMHDGPTRCWACLILNLRVFRASYHSVRLNDILGHTAADSVMELGSVPRSFSFCPSIAF